MVNVRTENNCGCTILAIGGVKAKRTSLILTPPAHVSDDTDSAMSCPCRPVASFSTHVPLPPAQADPSPLTTGALWALMAAWWVGLKMQPQSLPTVLDNCLLSNNCLLACWSNGLGLGTWPLRVPLWVGKHPLLYGP